MIKREMSSEHGQSMILIALVMIGLLAVLGLMIDGGNAYLSRRDAQNSADAAAFAGGQALRNTGITDQGVRTAIDNYALANHVANPSSDLVAYYLDQYNNQIPGTQVGSNGSNPPPPGATGIVVTSTISFNSLFISVVTGGGPTAIPARAKVQTGSLTSAPGDLVPMVIPVPSSCLTNGVWLQTNPCFTYHQEVDLFGSTQAAGNLQWINLLGVNTLQPPPQNTSDTAKLIVGTLSPAPVKIGDWLTGDTGVSFGGCANHLVPPLNQIDKIGCALDYYLQKPYDQRRVIVPVYFQSNALSGGNFQYQVIQFAAFYLTGYNMGNGQWDRVPSTYTTCTDPFTGVVNPNGKCIRGEFEKFTTTGEVDPTKVCNNTGLNICAVQLQE